MCSLKILSTQIFRGQGGVPYPCRLLIAYQINKNLTNTNKIEAYKYVVVVLLPECG